MMATQGALIGATWATLAGCNLKKGKDTEKARAAAQQPKIEPCRMGEVKDCENKCEQRDITSCIRLGQMYDQGAGVRLLR